MLEETYIKHGIAHILLGNGCKKLGNGHEKLGNAIIVLSNRLSHLPSETRWVQGGQKYVVVK